MSEAPKSWLILIIVLFGFFFFVHNVNGQPINFTLDFEEGNLRGWKQTDKAFENQPTLGDNPTARNRGQPSNHQGRYWIGTYEKYQGRSDQKPGGIQGDRPQGTLTSASFTISRGTLSFLVGGGSSFETRIEFVIVDVIEQQEKRVYHASGRNTETMHRVTWDLNQYAGKTGRIRIVDESSQGWGHINVDDFKFSSTSVVPSDQGVKVPDLVGRNVYEAERLLHRVQLRLGEIIRKPSDQEAGTILRQSPAAHSKVKRGTPVHIWVAERELVEVPNLVRHHIKEAEGILRESRLRLGEITKRVSDQEVDNVLQQEPVAGSRVPVGTSVNLLVAARRMIEVPNLVGQSIRQAKEILKEARLQIGSLAEEVSNRKPGTVFRQDPIAGTKVFVGSPVNLWIAAKGEKPVAKINPAHLRVTQGEKADFGSQSTPEGGIRERWTGPGGHKATGNSFRVYTDQLNPDSYVIMLEVIDRWGQTDRATATLEVIPKPVVKYNVTIQADPTSIEEGKSVRFEAALHPQIQNVQYRFNFGDQWSDWTVESELQHTYSSPGIYHAFVRVRKEGKIIAESKPVDIEIYRVHLPTDDRARRESVPGANGRPGIPPWLKWAGVIAGLGAVFSAGYYLSTKVHKQKKEKYLEPSIHIRPYKDIGIQQIESETPVLSGFEICLRPVLDKGKQDIEADGSLIDERRGHG
ncbi:MAG: PASTA domain-containing protein [Nitrospirota bacterium]